jgi:hypothetical protein
MVPETATAPTCERNRSHEIFCFISRRTPMAPYLRLLTLSIFALGLSGCISPEGHAKRVHKQMTGLQKVLLQYEEENGHLPEGSSASVKKALIAEGFLKRYPRPHSSLFGLETEGTAGEYMFHSEWDRMDEGPTLDSALGLSGLTDDFCRLFNSLYSSDSSGPNIYDFEANNRQYPATTIGKHMLIYAIKWESETVDDCTIEWVVRYR